MPETIRRGSALLINAGGRVSADRLKIEAYTRDPISFFQTRDINTGDLLVGDTILKHTAYEIVDGVQLQDYFNDPTVRGKTYDVAIIRGSNYLTEEIDLGYGLAVLDELDCPVVAIGIGAQASSYRRLAMQPGTIRFWQAVSERCKTIGARGAYSAEMLEAIGVKNIDVIGCPTVYRSGRSQIAMKRVPRDARVGLTLNGFLKGSYTSSQFKSRRIQARLLEDLAGREGSIYYTQGSRNESLVSLLRSPEQDEHIEAVLSLFGIEEREKVANFLRDKCRLFLDVEEWEQDIARNIDVMIGTRLHGNLIALGQGIPSLFYVYDTRTREIADWIGAAGIDVDDFDPVRLDEIVEKVDASAFASRYPLNFRRYVEFLDRNDVRHNLQIAPKPRLNFRTRAELGMRRVRIAADKETWLANELDKLAVRNDAVERALWFERRNNSNAVSD